MAKVSKCDSCEGESVVMNRKNKLFFIFDLTFTMRYEATLTPADGQYPVKFKGEIKLRDVASDGSAPAVKVSGDESNASGASAKDAARIAQLLRDKALAPLLALVDPVLDEMRGQIDGLQAPRPDVAPSTPTPTATAAPSKSVAAASAPSPTPSPAKTASLMQTLDCDVPPRELFACFVDASRVQAFTGAPAGVEARVGAQFSVYGGAVSGEVLECRAPELLTLKWRFQSWPTSAAASHVALRFEAVGDGARSRLTLRHSDIPAAEVDRTAAFWEQQFWTRMRALFGWRLVLL